MRNATGKEDPELPLLQRISSLEVNCTSDCSPNKCFRVQVTEHQLFRGGCMNQAFMVELLQRNHYYRTPIRRREQWTLDQRKYVLWSDESKFEIFGSNRRVFVRRRVGERMIFACVVPTVKHGGGVMV
jgi:hypothetical protein